MNYYVFRHHERPDLPYGQFWYALLYSLMQNLFLKFHFLNWIHGLNLNYRYFRILSLSLLIRYWSLIFLNLSWKIFRHREKLHLPYGQSSYVLPYSWKQNLFSKFHFQNLKKTFLFLMSQIRSLNQT